MHAAVESNHGQIIKTTGDGLCAVFASAVDGIFGVVARQRAMQAESWMVIGPLPVRMALHTGEAGHIGDTFRAAGGMTKAADQIEALLQ